MKTFASICSGVGGPDIGLERGGFKPAWMCEIDKSCQQVLRRRFPGVPIYNDMEADDITVAERPDIVWGSTPCQGFSVAGLRKGLNDDRSNLALRFVQLCDRFQPKLILWENVPGVLSMADNAFGCFLAGLVGADAPLVPSSECGGRWTNAGVAAGPKRTAAWRVLDSQYFGVAQRRERVFVVASPRAELPFQILFEPEGVRRHSPPRREAGQRTAPTLEGRFGRSGANNFATSGGLAEVAGTLSHNGKAAGSATQQDAESGLLIAHSLNDPPGGRYDYESETFVTHSLRADVRRLTPRECERLQGFPDDWTLVENTRGKPMADGPRYKQMGNAVTVNVVEWLARRIKAAL